MKKEGIKERIYEFDIIRALAAYAVIVVHVSALALSLYPPDSPAFLLTVVLNRFLKFTTPTFLFLGGVMVAVKYAQRPFHPVGFYKDRLLQIYVPYFFFTCFYYMSNVFFYQWQPNVSFFLETLFWGTAKYHLYFVIIIMQLYLLVPLFLPLRNAKHRWMAALLAGAVSLTAVLTLQGPYADRAGIKYLFPFVMGLLYGTDLLETLKKKWVPPTLLTLAFAAGSLYTLVFYHESLGIVRYSLFWHNVSWFFYTNLAVYSLLIIAGWMTRHQTLKSLSLKVTTFSFYVYLIHPFVLERSEGFLNTLGITSITLRFTIALTVTIAVTTWLAKRTKPLADRLLGGGRKPVL